MFACKCLNVLIHVKNNDIQKNDLDSLQLSEEEKIDPFFKKEVSCIVVESITKQQSGLVLSRQVGLWVIQMCINCSLDTHAVHKDKGASCVLIAGNLLNGSTNISSLRSNDNFSSAFGILIDPVLSDDDMDTKIAVSQLPETLQVAVNGLQQQLVGTLRREVASTEDRVRRFTESQYAALETFRDQVHKEHNILLRLVLNSQLMDASVKKLEHSPVNSPSSYQSPKAVTNVEERRVQDMETGPSPKRALNKPKHPIVTNLASKTKRSLPRQMSTPVHRMDSEDGILFPMDGMDESPTHTHSDAEESDTDGVENGKYHVALIPDSASHDEGIHIPRQRTQSVSIAKSLPMNIPVFMSAFPHEIADDRDDLKAKEDLIDIAASIKALAKSVHGDDVFGDLPRPRFSTQF